MIKDIVLIGPIETGKSTLGKLLSKKLNLPQASLDAVHAQYLVEAGFDPAKAQTLLENEGFPSFFKYRRRFYLSMLERHLKEHRNCVIDLGAGHSVYWENNELEQAQKILASYQNVILILPSPNLDESLAILRQRYNQDQDQDRLDWLERMRQGIGFDIDEHFLRHPSNFELAKLTVYTKNETPEQTRDKILELINHPS